MKRSAILISVLAFAANGATLQFAYTSGKQANSFDIKMAPYIGDTASPSLIQVGSVFSIQPYMASDGLAVCGDQAELGLQILVTGGVVQKTLSGDPAWTDFNHYPDSVVNMDSVPKITPWLDSIPEKPGYVFGHTGADNNCIGTLTSFTGNYGQVVFVHKGGIYAKIKIIGYDLTDNSHLTSPSQILHSITIRYLVSDNPNDLLDDSISTPPILTAPAQNATSVALSLGLNWKSSFGADSYRVQLAKDSLFTTLVVNDSTLTAVSRNVGPLSGNTAYYWRVNAKNPYGTSTFSAVSKFTTQYAITAAPVLGSPAENDTGVSVSVYLTWSSVATANDYRIQVSTDSTFTSSMILDNTNFLTNESVGPLSNTTTYYWRVSARNPGGTSPWSSVSRFTTTGASPIMAAAFLLQSPVVGNGNALRFGLSHPARVTIRIFNSSGRMISELLDAQRAAGYYSLPLPVDELRGSNSLIDFRAEGYHRTMSLSR